MSLENGSVRAEQVTAGMDLLYRGVWRPVLTDATVVTVRSGRRARIILGKLKADIVEDTDTLDLVAHSVVRVRLKRSQAEAVRT